MTSRNILVCKIGGSLFGWPKLFPRLEELLAAETRHVLLIAGGGPPADVVRQWDRRHGFDAEAAHRLAIRSMRLGEALLAECLPNARVVDNLDQARGAWSAGLIPIANIEGWRNGPSPALNRLPASWDITSDSIAAALARELGAALLLVKSTTPDEAGAAFVDPTFPEIARGLPVTWCDLPSGARGRWPGA